MSLWKEKSKPEKKFEDGSGSHTRGWGLHMWPCKSPASRFKRVRVIDFVAIYCGEWGGESSQNPMHPMQWFPIGLSYCFSMKSCTMKSFTFFISTKSASSHILLLFSVKITILELRLVPGKIGFLTWGRRGRRRVNPEEVILEESPQVRPSYF